jgi:hypothetical protein
MCLELMSTMAGSRWTLGRLYLSYTGHAAILVRLWPSWLPIETSQIDGLMKRNCVRLVHRLNEAAMG